MIAMPLSSSTTHAPDHSPDRSLFWWSLAGILLSFLCFAQFLVMICFLLGWSVSSLVSPFALVISLAAGHWMARGGGMHPLRELLLGATALAIVGISLLLAAAFYDMSWDGLWYHQTAVYQMAHGWNPIFDPMHGFVSHLQDWVRHYAKGPWYVALALYATTNNIEMAKAAPWIAFAATFFAVIAATMDFSLRRRTGILIAALVALNPVTVFELASFLVDGLMISFLACFAAALFSWLRRPSRLNLWIMPVAAILCVNAKMTGLVYLCFACAAGGLYVVLKRRELLGRYLSIQSASLAAGVLLFGFNPYVTNTIHRGHPFYPILGTAAYPSLSQQGQDPIEQWETPHNMMGRSRYLRLAYALFGRPGAQPYYPGTDASLMLPLDIGWDDFAIYYFHDVRISGFGPLFSGAVLLSAVLLGLALRRPGIPREIILIVAGAIVLSLLVSTHTWWARYGPQLWWLPILAVIAGLAGGGGRATRWLTWTLLVLLLVNVIPIAVVHFRWEADATRTTHEQMLLLREKNNIEVDFQYFGEPFSERLKNAGVRFTPVQHLKGTAPMELMSVSPGYPCAVRACFTK